MDKREARNNTIRAFRISAEADQCGELELVLGLINQAIADVTNGRRGTESKAKRESAIGFIKSRDFDFWCGTIGVDPEWGRERIRKDTPGIEKLFWVPAGRQEGRHAACH